MCKMPVNNRIIPNILIIKLNDASGANIRKIEKTINKIEIAIEDFKYFKIFSVINTS